MDSILDTIKTTLGVELDFSGFDQEIILGVNTAIMSLTQLGIGPTNGYVISGVGDQWYDFIGNATNIEAVKTYIGMKTRLIFDPPTSSFVLAAMENQLKEMEFRLLVQVDPPVPPETPVED